jgi:hypothetical protein
MRRGRRPVVLAILGLGLAAAVPARGAEYHCVPLEVAVLDARVHVECAAPAPKTRGAYPVDTGHAIVYFAVSLTGDAEFANRFIKMADLAITAGLPIHFLYTSGDYSGEAFGCSRQNCRTPWAFSLVRTTTLP